MIILFGPPASGKSTLYLRYLTDFVRFNNDTYRFKDAAFIEKVLNLLEEGKSVVIDNLNAKK